MGLIETIIEEDEELKGNGTWLHGAKHDSLVVNTETQRFYWNSKEIYGDVYSYLIKVRGMTFPEAKEYLKQYDNTAFFGRLGNTYENSTVYPKLVDIFYENGKEAPRDYWYRRGINDTTIERFKLGFHEDWYTVPFFQEGIFMNFQMRRDQPEKQVMPYYRGIGRTLFNADVLKITNEIIIAEGPTSALRLLQEGVPCVTHNAGATGWDSNWFRYFFKQKVVYVVYDNDSAGNLGALKVAESLGQYKVKIYTFKGREKPGYDIVDYFRDGGNVDEFLKEIRENSKYAYELQGV